MVGQPCPSCGTVFTDASMEDHRCPGCGDDIVPPGRAKAAPLSWSLVMPGATWPSNLTAPPAPHFHLPGRSRRRRCTASRPLVNPRR
jgi:hypothetical protein